MSTQPDSGPPDGLLPATRGVSGRWVVVVTTIVIGAIAWFIIWGVTR